MAHSSEMSLIKKDPTVTFEEMAATAQARQQPVRVRMLLTVYDLEASMYRAWPGVVQLVEFPDAERAQTFREALDLFYAVTAEVGPTTMLEHLQQVQAYWAQQAQDGAVPQPRP